MTRGIYYVLNLILYLFVLHELTEPVGIILSNEQFIVAI